MFCGDSTTICTTCGKLVHSAPGICILCGEILVAKHVIHVAQPEAPSTRGPQPSSWYSPIKTVYKELASREVKPGWWLENKSQKINICA